MLFSGLTQETFWVTVSFHNLWLIYMVIFALVLKMSYVRSQNEEDRNIFVAMIILPTIAVGDGLEDLVRKKIDSYVAKSNYTAIKSNISYEALPNNTKPESKSK